MAVDEVEQADTGGEELGTVLEAVENFLVGGLRFLCQSTSCPPVMHAPIWIVLTFSCADGAFDDLLSETVDKCMKGQGRKMDKHPGFGKQLHGN